MNQFNKEVLIKEMDEIVLLGWVGQVEDLDADVKSALAVIS